MNECQREKALFKTRIAHNSESLNELLVVLLYTNTVFFLSIVKKVYGRLYVDSG